MSEKLSQTPHTYEASLEISLDNSGKDAVIIAGMYADTRFIEDINQTAWNLCDCDDEKLKQEFGSLTLVTSDIETSRSHDTHLNIVFRVTSMDQKFIQEVTDEYMDGFEDWIREAELGYYSRKGVRTGISLGTGGWKVSISEQN